MSAINPGWNFDNSYARLPKKLFSPVNPTPVSAPELVVLNHPLAKRLGLNPEVLQSGDGLAVLAGNSVPDGALPIAQAYAGHQFGYFTMLGDGRAILLGEQITPEGERCDIQLKGPGLTPYSRGGDGRAALGPMLREYIISEAMHALGIATTRSLAVVTTGETIMRDTVLPGAILTRVAASHIRVGTFQYASQWGGVEELQTLADYTIRRHYPDIYNDDNRYLTLLHEVVKRQATLIATWQLVGFVHGVMNTDNMAISGETIDYGPCAFMDAYDPATVFSSIDRGGRYAYGKQPDMAAWNLARFAEALLPLIHDDSDQAVKLAQDEISRFGERFRCNWLGGMRAKLGLSNEEPEDEQLIERLLGLMNEHQADYTNTLRALTFARVDGSSLFTTPEFQQWQVEWKARLARQPQSEAEVLELMRQSNPALIPRNHKVEEALEAAEHGDYGVMEKLLRALANPFAHSAEQEEYAMPSGRPYKTFCGT